MSGAWHVLAPFLRRQWRALIVAAFATVVVAAVEVLRPFPLKLVIDHLFAAAAVPGSFELGGDELVLLAAVVGLVLGIAVVEAVGGYLMDVHMSRAGERIVHDLRIAIYAHMQRLSLGFHQRRHTGDLVTRVTGDVNAVGNLFSSALGTLVAAGLSLLGMVAVGWVIDPVLALIAFATAPVIGLVAVRFRRQMRHVARRQRRMEGEIASMATEALGSIQQVKALGSELHEHGRLERKSEERLAAGFEATLVSGRFTRIIDLVGAVATAAVLVAGVFRVAAGALSPGDLIVMATYSRRIQRPMRSLAREWFRVSQVMARADRVAEVLSADELLEDRASAEREGSARGALTFEAVSFAYETDRPALRDLSLTIPAGQRVAVVGRSGAGKSTLAALAARFYDPAAGRVLIDGVDVRELPLSWLREQVGFVLQDAVLFTGSVAENIGWATDAGREEIIRAAKAVGADEFIRGLPKGYDTELDPGGAGLSGGQRQRIAIARTLLRDPAILLLDEPTTGLDSVSEADVLAGLDVLMRGRTTVMITHSLPLARRAEQAIVLDEGRVVQSGPPTELLVVDGPFRRMAEEHGLVDKQRPQRPPGIADPELPQAGVMLDTTELGPILARSYDGSTALDVRIRYLRYKPGTNLVVHYEIEADGGRHDAVGMIASTDNLARRATKPENVALARLVRDRVTAAEPLAYDADVGCLLQWYPLDLSLPQLARPPADLRRMLQSAGLSVNGHGGEPERLAYKPRRRAVLRLDGHVMKLYRRFSEYEYAVAGQRAASNLPGLVTPRLEAALPDHLVSVQSLLRGTTVPSAPDAARDAGVLLALLHASGPSGLVAFGPPAQLAAATASARLVAAISVELRPQLTHLVDQLAAWMPTDAALVPSHGDFNARQLLVVDGALALTDFDAFCLAPRALDPATYAAYLVRGGEDDLDAALAALDDLIGGYGEWPPHLEWYLATMILRRAARPFRYFDPDWRPRVEQMVAASTRALDTYASPNR